jgi:hypothetical protein
VRHVGTELRIELFEPDADLETVEELTRNLRLEDHSPTGAVNGLGAGSTAPVAPDREVSYT